MDRTKANMLIATLSWIEIGLGAVSIALTIWMLVWLQSLGPEADPHGFMIWGAVTLGVFGLVAIVAGGISRLGRVWASAAQLGFLGCAAWLYYEWFI